MWLSEMLFRLRCQEATKRKREGTLHKLLVGPFRMGKSANGLVAIPNKIRKRFTGATR